MRCAKRRKEKEEREPQKERKKEREERRIGKKDTGKGREGVREDEC